MSENILISPHFILNLTIKQSKYSVQAMRQGMFFSLFGEIHMRQGSVLQFIAKIQGEGFQFYYLRKSDKDCDTSNARFLLALYNTQSTLIGYTTLSQEYSKNICLQLLEHHAYSHKFTSWLVLGPVFPYQTNNLLATPNIHACNQGVTISTPCCNQYPNKAIKNNVYGHHTN